MKGIESRLTGGYWGRWQAVNRESAIFHQWAQLEATGCIDNFRILAEGKPVSRTGLFFADSDAYKWLEAAYRILAQAPAPRLTELVEEFVGLIRGAQAKDGYLYTFNQIHFPGTRWVNLQIEHELYCHGHLIEACIAGYRTTGDEVLLDIARRLADRITEDFYGKGPRFTPGHEEIEIALLRLFEVTGNEGYFNMARQFVEQRGKDRFFALEIVRQFFSNNRRVEQAQKQVNEDQAVPAEPLPEGNTAKSPPLNQLRFYFSALSGKLLQQHKPLTRQAVPVGHAVRFAYLQTAGAMLDRLSGTAEYRGTLAKSWQHMVGRRMYLTGGIGSLPGIEGFGRDYELDPAVAYAESCAALGSMYWNREMSKLTHETQYSDLFEWQLYNAALVGMGWEGVTYLYNNPLASMGEIERRAWYKVPCCPSNLSRTWAALQDDVLDFDGEAVYIQQYFSSQHRLSMPDGELEMDIESGLPWSGEVKFRIGAAPGKPITLRMRQPSWTSAVRVVLNGVDIRLVKRAPAATLMPQEAAWLEITRTWKTGDRMTLDFELPVRVLHAHRKVRSVRGQVAISRGPLVYCLESIDNPGVDLFGARLYSASLEAQVSELFDGAVTITGREIDGVELTFIPYHLWGNRGPTQMSVFVRV
jgi:hypothetical protein